MSNCAQTPSPLVARVGPGDFFGSELNLASKLGEDVATAGEVLLTAAAQARARRWKRKLRARRTRMRGLALTFYALEG